MICELAFKTLKPSLTSDSVVNMPDLSKDFIVKTDASNSALGADLLQEHEDQLFPVAYKSLR